MTDREISLPFRVDASGRIATVSDPDEIARQHIRCYVQTEQGERVMRPSWGSPMSRSVFESLDQLTASLVHQRILDSVGRDLQTAQVMSVSTPLSTEDATLQVVVEYALNLGGGVGSTSEVAISVGGSL